MNNIRINVANHAEVSFWAKKLRVKESTLIDTVNKVGSSITNVEEALQRGQTVDRLMIFVTALVTISFLIISIFVVFFSGRNPEDTAIGNSSRFTVAILTMVGVLSVMFYVWLQKKLDSKDESRIINERNEIKEKIERNDEDIFQTIQLSLNQIEEYYTINKNQAKQSFRVSTLSILVGFITIIVGIWLIYNGNNISLGLLAGASGVILEFFGGAQFLVYKRCLIQVNFFFGQLIRIQDTMLAISLAEKGKNEDVKSEIRIEIIKSLLERSLK